MVQCILFFFSVLLVLPSQAKSDYQLEVRGNKRTKESYLEHLFSDCWEESEEGKSEEKVIEQCIYNNKIFSSVKVIKKGKKKFLLEVEEKWTLLLIPYFQRQEGSSSYGLFAVETNLMGYGKTGILGYIGGGLNQMLFLMYKDKELFYSPYSLKLDLFLREKEYERREGERVVDIFKEKGRDFSGALGRYFWGKRLNLALFASDENFTYSRVVNYQLPESYHQIWVGPQVNIDWWDYKHYFQEGLKFTAQHEFATKKLSSSPKKAHRLYADLDMEKEIFLQTALAFRVEYYRGIHTDVRSNYKFGQKRGSRGIQSGSLWPNNFISLGLDYLIPVLEYSYGSYVAAPYYDWGKSDDVSYHSYGGGIYLYLSKINLSAVGFVAGYNKNFDKNFFTFTIGRGF